MASEGGRLDVQQSVGFERWRASNQRQQEWEASERQRQQETQRYLATFPQGWSRRENNPLVGQMMERRIGREKNRAALTVPFEMERARLRSEQIVAERQALEEVRRFYGETMAEIGQREMAALEVGETHEALELRRSPEQGSALQPHRPEGRGDGRLPSATAGTPFSGRPRGL